MRRLKRNQRTIEYYAVSSLDKQTDSQGYLTGRVPVSYATAVSVDACVVFRGTSSYKPYGIEEQWSVQIIPDNPIDGIEVGAKFVIDGKNYFVLSHPTTMNEQRIFCK